MNLKPIILGACALLIAHAHAQDKTTLATAKDKVSYSIGLNFGGSLKQQSIDVDVDLLAKGIKDALSDAKPLLTEQECRETLMAFQKDLMTKQQETAAKAGEKNKKEGVDFLASNKSKEGVVTLPSGLQYKVVKEGSGPTPKATDTVVTHYRGTLIDGAEFDSSYSRGEPATFPVTGVISGWTEALQLMKVGSKWQLFIPSDLAYRERGAGRQIGPNATLIFDIELLGIQGPEASPKKP